MTFMHKQTEQAAFKGLSAQEVDARVKRGQVNTPPVPLSKSTGEIIVKNVCTYFNLIFAVLAFLLIMVEDYRSLTFLPIIIINTLVGIVQEIRSKKALEKLTMLNAPKTRVLRDGEEQLIASEMLVVDDIVRFGAGNQIPADAELLSGEIQVNEALLTGEADEIKKTVGAQLYSGSFVVSGMCTARLTRVGTEAGIHKLTLEAKSVKGVERSKMILEIDKLLKCVGIAIIPIGILLFSSAHYALKTPVAGSVTSMVAALVGMIPEGLYLLTTMALVLSMMRLAKRKVLVRQMTCIEALARVDVLCVDKTGTITMPVMSVKGCVPTQSMDEAQLTALMTDFVAAMEDDNATMHTLKEHFCGEKHRTADKICSFSSEFKYSAASFDGECFVAGAPEFVLRDNFQAHADFIQGYAAQGYRTLAVARYEGVAEGKALTAPAQLLGLVLLENPIRESARETFHYFSQQGVKIKVISGDNPVTVSRVAGEAGIEDADKYVDASTLKTEEEMAQALQTCAVFGRVAPAQKRAFVRILKGFGHTVAMTGDGVNDVLALKDADCSIAMASGSDAAAQCAQLVLLESDFSKMPDVVSEGRRVVNNIERSASLFLVKNIFSIIMALLAIAFGFRYPITPAQMSLISGLTIGVPAFLLALEANHTRIRGNFLRNVFFKALPAALVDVVLISVLVLMDNRLGMVFEQTATAAFILMAVVGLCILYVISRPLNAYRAGVLVLMAGSITALSLLFTDLFRVVALPVNAAICVLALSVAAIPLMILFTKLIDMLEKKMQVRRAKAAG